MPQPIIWTEFSANSPAELAQWYSTIFGWSWRDLPEMHYATAAWSDSPTEPGVGFNKIGMGATQGKTVVYIHSADLDVDVQRVIDAGGTLTQGRMEVPGAGFMAWFTDPSGNAFALLQPVMPG
jgi:hypothetical protein